MECQSVLSCIVVDSENGCNGLVPVVKTRQVQPDLSTMATGDGRATILKLSIAAAAQEAGVTRQTLYKMKEAGKITFEQDAKGKHVVDTAELYRVYQAVAVSAQKAPEVNKQLESENRQLKDQLVEYREREQRHLGTIDRLTQLLEHKPVVAPPTVIDPATVEVLLAELNAEREKSGRIANEWAMEKVERSNRGFFSRLFGGDK